MTRPRITFVALLLAALLAPSLASTARCAGANKDQRARCDWLPRQPERSASRHSRSAAGRLARETTIPRSEIEEIIQTVSAERLAALSPREPQLYREYAEELAEKRRDPEAREAAIRLYQIAATLDPQNQGRGSLLGMIALALARGRSALPSRGLPRRSAPRREPLASDQRQRDDFRRRPPQRTCRTAPSTKARSTRARGASDEVRRAVGSQRATAILCGTTSHRRVLRGLWLFNGQRCAARKAAGFGAFARTALAADSTDTHTKRGLATSWRQAIASGQLESVRPATLEALTEFDPRANLFRDGKWSLPSEE